MSTSVLLQDAVRTPESILAAAVLAPPARRSAKPAPRRAKPTAKSTAKKAGAKVPARSTCSPRKRVEQERELALEREARATALMAAYRDSRSAEDFEALYAATSRDVHTWILSLLRQGPAHLDAQELLQDTFVNVYRYPKAFRDEQPGSFRVWVRTIAGNLVRRARARGGRNGLMLELPEGGLEPADERGGRPDQQADLSEAAQHLGRAWDLFLGAYLVAWRQLAERDALALQLVEVDELCYGDAAERLGVRPANMKMIVFRARKRLGTHMRRCLGGGAAPVA